jgi:hypothetical protein
MNPKNINPRQKLIETVTSALQGELATEVSSFIVSMAYRRFAPDLTLEKRVLLHEAVRVFLGTGDRDAAELCIAEGIDADTNNQELVSSVSDNPALDALVSKVRAVIAKDATVPPAIGYDEIVGRTTLLHLVDEVRRADTSTPLDISDGKEVTVCFIPGSSRVKDYRDTATLSWMDRSDSISIYPDRTFVEFLSAVGVSKADWLAAVERNTTMASAVRMRDHLAERTATWNEITEWGTSGSLDIDDDDLVAAVDACPHGFTPVIAFTMEAEEVFSMDFTETLEVTGGIVGLHNFTTGSGDPLRFEGTLRFSPGVGDMHIADDQPLGLIATHGFLSSAFVSTVSRCPSTALKLAADPKQPVP